MPQWKKALATKTYNISSVPRIHMVEGENELLRLTSDFHMHANACS